MEVGKLTVSVRDRSGSGKGGSRKLRAQGSELAKVRDEFVAEQGQLNLAVKQDEERLRDLAGATLPFAPAGKCSAAFDPNAVTHSGSPSTRRPGMAAIPSRILAPVSRILRAASV